MDGSFFAFALVGALVGYIVGDFQRERRYRRESRANLARSLARSNDRARARALAVRDLSTNDGTDDSTNDGGDGPAFALANVRHGDARRRAVRGDNLGFRTGPPPAGRRIRGADETALVPAGGAGLDRC